MSDVSIISERPSLQPAEFSRFAALVQGQLGIQLPEEKLPMLQGRLARRMRELNIASPGEYWKYLNSSPGSEGELTHFLDAVTTNKTDFFREPKHFDYLVRQVLAQWERPRGPRFSVWSAGCSSGEEPYTLAMVLAEYAQQHPGFDFAILATDVSTKVLGQARAGIYREEEVAPIPTGLRSKYLLRGKEKGSRLVRIVPQLRQRVSFHHLNFMDSDYLIRNNFDAIFFRNVMIYFDKPTQEAVIRKMCRNLEPGGYLFIGHSESLAGLDVPVRSLGAAMFRKPERNGLL